MTEGKFRENIFGNIKAAQPPKIEDSKNKVEIVKFDLIKDIEEHPFSLYSGERLDDMVESIKQNGILMPLILRKVDGTLFLLAGYNRRNAAILAGLDECPAIIKENISDEEAWIYVIETNAMQRSFSEMPASEQALVISIQYDKMFSQGKRNDIKKELNLLENPLDTNENSTSALIVQKLGSREQVAVKYGLNRGTIARLLRVNKLISKLKKMVDNDEIGIYAGVDISFISNNEQELLVQLIEDNKYKIDTKKATAIREYSINKKLTEETMRKILSGEKEKKEKKKGGGIKIKSTVLKKYFDENEEQEEILEVIEKALEMYFEQK